MDRLGLKAAIRETARLISQGWLPFLALAPLFWIPNLLYNYLPFPTFAEALSFDQLWSDLGAVLDFGVVILLQTPFQASLLVLTFQKLKHGQFDVGQAYAQALKLTPPLLLVNLVYLYLVYAGLLLIIPGLMFIPGLALAPAAYTAEWDGIIGSLHRSWAMTRGFRWGLLFLILAAQFAQSSAMSAITATLGDENPAAGIQYLFAPWIAGMLLAPILAVFFEQQSKLENAPKL